MHVFIELLKISEKNILGHRTVVFLIHIDQCRVIIGDAIVVVHRSDRWTLFQRLYGMLILLAFQYGQIIGKILHLSVQRVKPHFKVFNRISKTRIGDHCLHSFMSGRLCV